MSDDSRELTQHLTEALICVPTDHPMWAVAEMIREAAIYYAAAQAAQSNRLPGAQASGVKTERLIHDAFGKVLGGELKDDLREAGVNI